MRSAIIIGPLLLMLAAPAAAQTDRGADVSGNVAAVNMDDRTSWSFSGAVTFRFTHVLGFEVEATAAPDLHTNFPGVTIQTTLPPVFTSSLSGYEVVQSFPAPRFENAGGRLVLLSNNACATASEQAGHRGIGEHRGLTTPQRRGDSLCVYARFGRYTCVA